MGHQEECCNSNILNLDSAGTHFEPQPDCWLFLLRVLMIVTEWFSSVSPSECWCNRLQQVIYPSASKSIPIHLL